jgi:hypothetical protein
MSTTKSKILQIGQSTTTSNNYAITAENEDGTMTLVNSHGDENINVLTIDSNNNVRMESSSEIISSGSSGFNGVDGYKNKIINGNFDIWQRGTSSTTQATANNWLADRWSSSSLLPATVTGYTQSRQAFTLGQTEVPGNPSYFWRNAVTSYGTVVAGTFWLMQTKLEDITKYSNKTMTLSFWAKADSSRNVAVEFVQNFGSTGSTSVTGIGITKLTLSTTWQKYTVTVDLPSITSKTISSATNALNIDCLTINIWSLAGTTYESRTSLLGATSSSAMTIDLAQIQFEEGNIATEFEQRPLEVELELCQRYYQTAPAGLSWVTRGISTTNMSQVSIPRTVSLRTDLAVNFSITNPLVAFTLTGSFTTAGTATVNHFPRHILFVPGNNATGLTSGNTYHISTTATTAVNVEIST